MRPNLRLELIQSATLTLIIVVVLAVIGILLFGGGENVDQDNFSYHTIEIQGMTCIRWGNPIGYKGGLTCNWDEWEGRAE
jgi:hypothetical protein